jgi:hypothetical protein
MSKYGDLFCIDCVTSLVSNNSCVYLTFPESIVGIFVVLGLLRPLEKSCYNSYTNKGPMGLTHLDSLIHGSLKCAFSVLNARRGVVVYAPDLTSLFENLVSVLGLFVFHGS